jgi:hypothetical protein
LVQGYEFFRGSAAAPQIAGRYKPLNPCIRSGGVALDRCVALN